MNTTIRNLIIAAPLATAAFTLVPTAAMASEPGPVIVLAPHTDPEPKDKIALPKPKPPVEPKDKIALPKPKPPVEPKDKIALPKPKPPVEPKDKIALPKPKPPVEPKDKIALPKPCPTHGVDCTPDKDKEGLNGGDKPEGGNDDESTTPVDDVFDTVKLPNRIDAGLASEEQDGGMDIAWLFAGGLAVTASGVAFAVRKRTRSNA